MNYFSWLNLRDIFCKTSYDKFCILAAHLSIFSVYQMASMQVSWQSTCCSLVVHWNFSLYYFNIGIFFLFSIYKTVQCKRAFEIFDCFAFWIIFVMHCCFFLLVKLIRRRILQFVSILILIIIFSRLLTASVCMINPCGMLVSVGLMLWWVFTASQWPHWGTAAQRQSTENIDINCDIYHYYSLSFYQCH